MASLKLKPKIIRAVCNNCFGKVEGYRNETGLIRFQCGKCGTTMVSKVIGRRHVQLDVYAPQGQELIDGETND